VLFFAINSSGPDLDAATVVYFHVADIEATLAKIQRAAAVTLICG
jgi:predicted enzyme related to lactoylglutathione lyase